MDEIIQEFLVESAELLEQLDADLVTLEERPDDLELLNRIFRAAHTIKGSSGFLGFTQISQLTHHMEDVLNKLRKGEMVVTPTIMDVILESVDKLKMLLEEVKNGTSGTVDTSETEAKLKAILEQNSQEQEAQESQGAGESGKDQFSQQQHVSLEQASEETTQTTESVDKQEQVAPSEEKDLSQASEEKPTSDQKKQPESNQQSQKVEEKQQAPESKQQGSQQVKQPSQQAKPTKAQPKKSSGISSIEETIRVDVKRLDALMNLVGELVLVRNRLGQLAEKIDAQVSDTALIDTFNNALVQLGFVTTEMQLSVMKTRMLPIQRVFNKFPRMVRDLCREMKKEVDLIIHGEETELDKSVIEHIGDPLIHILRNAVDHGIEPPEERERLGKPRRGTIILSAYQEGDHIVIEVSDDGRGIDIQKVAKKALEKGVIKESDLQHMGDRDILNLIFMPGFSTAEKITDVSGRGVGMDVVKTNIEKLNGVIELDTEIGKGTTLRIKLPLTLAIIQALMVLSNKDIYAIPLASVQEIVHLEEGQVYTIDQQAVVRIRDMVIPLLCLEEIFGEPNKIEETPRRYVVIIGLVEQRLGLLVSDLLGQQEVVIKSLGGYLTNVPGIAGATIMGDGRVCLILDVTGIMQLSSHSVRKVAAA